MKAAVAVVLALVAGSVARAEDGSYPDIERGRALATAADCMPCHSPPGGTPWAGGRAVQTPFGTLLSANITPDMETGIGRWSDDQFVDVLLRGMAPGGKHIYPAMPYPYYTKMTRDDALAIRAYLATLDPVRNVVHADQLPFPLSVRTDMIGWNALNFSEGTFKPVAGKSPEWNRGAYLVEALGHCAACHTAKTISGGDETSRTLQGGSLQGWYAPNLTNDERTGLGRWSADDVVEYLATGHNSLAAAAGPMAEVVQYSTSQMKREDLHAIAVYLKDRPGQGEGQDHAPSPVTDVAAGEAIYVDQCASCHRVDGTGVPRLFPSLARGASVVQDNPVSTIRVVLEGVRTVATAGAPTGPGMPAFGWKLSDAEIAAVLTYVRNAWGNAAAPVSASTVARQRQSLSAAN